MEISPPRRASDGRDAALRRPRTAIHPAITCADGAARRPYHRNPTEPKGLSNGISPPLLITLLVKATANRCVESRFQRSAVSVGRNPGALPQASNEAAPLARRSPSDHSQC